MHICIVPILNERKPLSPLDGTSMGKAPTISLKTLVDSFYSTIYLQMRRRAHAQLSTRECHDLLRKMTGKDTIINYDDGLRHTMKGCRLSMSLMK